MCDNEDRSAPAVCCATTMTTPDAGTGEGFELPPRFPRASVLLEAAALAERCRCAAGELEDLAGQAYAFEASTLRRRAHGVVRGLVLQLGEAVAL